VEMLNARFYGFWGFLAEANIRLAIPHANAPKNTPAEIVDKLNNEINATLSDPKMKARLAELGTTPMVFTPSEFGSFVKAETEKWAKVIKFSGAKPD
jgi:tripartite-type tricarboxylate transporter receptor subunit TctC